MMGIRFVEQSTSTAGALVTMDGERLDKVHEAYIRCCCHVRWPLEPGPTFANASELISDIATAWWMRQHSSLR